MATKKTLKSLKFDGIDTEYIISDSFSVVLFDYDASKNIVSVTIDGISASLTDVYNVLSSGKASVYCKFETHSGTTVGTITSVLLANNFVCEQSHAGINIIVDFNNFTVRSENTDAFVYEAKTSKDLNIKNGAGAGSLQMNNTHNVDEPDDANTGVIVTSTEKPQANGAGSFAIGIGTKAEGNVSVAEGINTTAGYVRDDGSRNIGSHAEGIHTFAKSSGSHAEGFYTESLASNSHTEGFQTKVNSDGWSGHAEGRETVVNNRAAHAEGYQTQANGTEGHAEGYGSVANGNHSHAEGKGTNAQGLASHAEGDGSSALGEASHAEGGNSKATSKYAHAEGNTAGASGSYSHAEGDRTNATGSAAHAEGVLTTAKYRSHAEGEGSTAGGDDGDSRSRAAHAEGLRTTATGTGSHSEGRDTKATAQAAHAEGAGTTASGVASHAGGTSTIAQWDNSTVIGKYNKTTNLSNTSSNPLFIIGNGSSDTNRKNALEVFADGTAYVNSKKILVEGETNFLKSITGYDASKIQILSHDANGNIAWINSIDI